MHHRSRLLLYIASCILSILFMSFTLTTTGLDQQCQVYRVHLGTGVPKYFHDFEMTFRVKRGLTSRGSFLPYPPPPPETPPACMALSGNSVWPQDLLKFKFWWLHSSSFQNSRELTTETTETEAAFARLLAGLLLRSRLVASHRAAACLRGRK